MTPATALAAAPAATPDGGTLTVGGVPIGSNDVQITEITVARLKDDEQREIVQGDTIALIAKAKVVYSAGTGAGLGFNETLFEILDDGRIDQKKPVMPVNFDVQKWINENFHFTFKLLHSRHEVNFRPMPGASWIQRLNTASIDAEFIEVDATCARKPPKSPPTRVVLPHATPEALEELKKAVEGLASAVADMNTRTSGGLAWVQGQIATLNTNLSSVPGTLPQILGQTTSTNAALVQANGTLGTVLGQATQAAQGVQALQDVPNKTQQVLDQVQPLPDQVRALGEHLAHVPATLHKIIELVKDHQRVVEICERIDVSTTNLTERIVHVEKRLESSKNR
jgi:hypothetical protein